MLSFIITIAILCGTQYYIIMNTDTVYTNQILELRRGTITLAILSVLRQPHYGYGLLRALEDAGIVVDAGTLYPLLRRLEKQEILASEWDTSDARPRRYYSVSKQGQELYKKLQQEWNMTQNKLNILMESK